ncbi:MAG TPA: phytanoyl-CoA dioxygenase family protein [Candidatus Limnocylindria bacterium]|jgi:hypothetical protein|nr:phytanoyl-CoA dioxygenase family protein [Candidatus Limnocylindria bacterium]
MRESGKQAGEVSQLVQTGAMARASRFVDDGYELFSDVVDSQLLAELQRTLQVEPGRAGERRLLDSVSVVRSLCRQGELLSLARSLLGEGAFPVRAILFDKTPDSNWKVPWHQDLAIPVREKRESEGFVGWSQKEGVWHVCPPASVLDHMVTLRLHLDNCAAVNGPLRVLPGSHRLGVLSVSQVTEMKVAIAPFICLARAGDVLAMKPLLLHASSPAEVPSHRRVLHVEYARRPLPGGLEWASAE